MQGGVGEGVALAAGYRGRKQGGYAWVEGSWGGSWIGARNRGRQSAARYTHMAFGLGWGVTGEEPLCTKQLREGSVHGDQRSLLESLTVLGWFAQGPKAPGSVGRQLPPQGRGCQPFAATG